MQPIKEDILDKQQRTYWPTHAWKSVPPEDLGVDPAHLAQVHAYASELTCLHSILLVRSGFVVFEEYYQGWNPKRYHNIMSCTKTVVASLVGIALRESYLKSVDQPLLEFFPEYAPSDIDPRKRAITLRHLLTMKSGYGNPNASGSSHDITAFLDESDSAIKILDRPMQYEPGQVYSYDNMNTHLLGHILSRVTGKSLAHFAYTMLFQPLGIWQDEADTTFPWKDDPGLIDDSHPFGLWDQRNEYLWSIDRLGHFIGSFGLQLTPREMAKYGYLYLNHGQWEGQQIIPETYIDETMQYGYIKQFARWRGHEAFFNTGALGQAIVVVPDLDLVAVMTAFCNKHDHLKEIVDQVLPGVL